MDKPGQLRDWLVRAVPELQQNPERLHLLVDRGHIQCTPAGESLSYEYQYELTLLITDLATSVDAVTLPLLAWCQTNQPELFSFRSKDGISFRYEPLNHDSGDLEITLNLTERVTVTETGGAWQIDHPEEPVFG